MEGEGARGILRRFDMLDDDYRTWSVYCKAYLQNIGVWHTVVSPRPVVEPPPIMAQHEKSGDEASSSAAHAAASRVMSAHEKQVKELAVWERKEMIALSNIKLSVKKHLIGMLEDCQIAAEA